MEIALLKQTKTSNCGQTCIAMVTGKSIAEVERAFGGVCGGTRYGGVTFSGQQVSVLKLFGVKCADQYVSVPANRDFAALPKTALVRLAFLKRSGGRLSKTKTKRTGHLVVWHEGKVYDPNGYAILPEMVRPDMVIERYLPIEG